MKTTAGVVLCAWATQCVASAVHAKPLACMNRFRVKDFVIGAWWGPDPSEANYRAYQEGPTRFRFILRPYRKSSPAENTRFATGFSQPLLALPARGANPAKRQLLQLNTDRVLVTGLKPSDDGRAIVVRLFGASGKTESVKLNWGAMKPSAVFVTDTSEKPGVKLGQRVTIPAYGLVSLRAELE